MDLDETMTTTSTSSTTPSVLRDIADPDADEGYDDDNDNLFPQSTNTAMSDDHHDLLRPRTPPANDHLNAAAPGELSPPRSQTRTSEDSPATRPSALLNGVHSNSANANMSATRSSARIAAAAGAAADGDTNNNHAANANASSTTSAGAGAGAGTGGGADRDEKPIGAWRSKKAQDEMQRAWDNIVDRDFSLAEFGDVVLLGKARMGVR